MRASPLFTGLMPYLMRLRWKGIAILVLLFMRLYVLLFSGVDPLDAALLASLRFDICLMRLLYGAF